MKVEAIHELPLQHLILRKSYLSAIASTYSGSQLGAIQHYIAGCREGHGTAHWCQLNAKPHVRQGL